MDTSDLTFGLQMAVVGMGTVFLLLSLLWGALTLIGRLDREPAATPLAKPSQDQALVTSSAASLPSVVVHADGLDDDTLAAITVAVLAHAEIQRRQAAPAMRSHQPGSLMYASRWVNMGRSLQHRAKATRWRDT